MSTGNASRFSAKVIRLVKSYLMGDREALTFIRKDGTQLQQI